MQPGDIYFASFGTDQKHRVIIVSREELNRGKYVLAVPTISKRFKERRGLPNCVAIAHDTPGFSADCVAQTEALTQIKIDDLDLEQGCVGQMEPEKMREIIRAIGYTLLAECEPS